MTIKLSKRRRQVQLSYPSISTLLASSREHPINADILALNQAVQEKSAPLGALFPWLGISDSNTRMTESESLIDIQKRAVLNDFSLKIARFTYSPHDLPHKSPRNFIRH